MPRLDLLSTIDPDSAAWRVAEATLQGNVAKPHGRDHTAMLLFVMEEAGGTQVGLRGLAAEYVTSAQQQRAHSETKDSAPNTVEGNLGLSVTGYGKLGVTREALEHAFRQRYGRNWFLDGMAGRAQELGDEEALQEEFYSRETVDGYLLLACADRGVLQETVKAAKATLAGFCRIIHEEWGQLLRDNGVLREPFGFRDGIAMPTILGGERGESLLFEDRLASQKGHYGTFVVYRKLEQDVAGFETAVQGLASTAQVPKEYAEAMIMGRFKDGTPLSNANGPTAGMEAAAPDFWNDLDGGKCPFQAHVRKVNPQWTPRRRRVSIPLYRRSTPYATEEKQGLLFLAMQENIGHTFGEMMRKWVNGPDFLKRGTGTDALLGTPGGTQDWNGTAFDVGRHVAFRGGEFFYLPSLSFFATLGD